MQQAHSQIFFAGGAWRGHGVSNITEGCQAPPRIDWVKQQKMHVSRREWMPGAWGSKGKAATLVFFLPPLGVLPPPPLTAEDPTCALLHNPSWLASTSPLPTHWLSPEDFLPQAPTPLRFPSFFLFLSPTCLLKCLVSYSSANTYTCLSTSPCATSPFKSL